MKTRDELKQAIDHADTAVDEFLDLINASKGGVLICGDVSAIRSTSVTLPIRWRSGAIPVSAMNFDISLPLGVSFGGATPGSVLIQAQKQVLTNIVNGALRVLIFGPNQTEIKGGLLTEIQLQVGASAFQSFQCLAVLNVAFSTPAGFPAKAFAISGGLTIS